MATRRFGDKFLQLTRNNFFKTCNVQPHQQQFAKLLSTEQGLGDKAQELKNKGRHTVTMVPGVGTGPELMTYVRKIFKFIKAPIDFEIIETIEGGTQEEQEQYLQDVIASIRRTGVAIKGNIEMDGPTGLNGLDEVKESRCFQIRKQLDLYVMLSRCYSIEVIEDLIKHKNVDVTLVRENLGGFYSMLEHETVPGCVENLKVVTKANCERVARFAFDIARKEGKTKVTTVHKANIMKLSDGLFLETANEVAKDYLEIKHDNMIIDNCCMQLVTNPQQFEVMLLPNLYGSICANVLSGLIGGPGLMAGQNIGSDCVVFEAMTRNSGTGIAGRKTANPTAMLNAAANLLDHLGRGRDARAIRDAILIALSDPDLHTPDLGGTARTCDMIYEILGKLVYKYDIGREKW